VNFQRDLTRESFAGSNPKAANDPLLPLRTAPPLCLSSFDFLSHTFDFKPFGFLCSPWRRSVLDGFGGGMNTCFGSKLVGSAFVQPPHFGRLPLGGALGRNGCGSLGSPARITSLSMLFQVLIQPSL
jgi:hypothetical protein